MHFHVYRKSYNSHTGDPLEPVEVGIALDYMQARAVKWEDQKQFRLPSADRGLMHDWQKRMCNDDSHTR